MSRRAAHRAASRIRDIEDVRGREISVEVKDGWPTVVVPADVAVSHPEVYELIWAEDGLPDWPRPKDGSPD